MAVLLGLLGALVIGTGDFCGRTATRASNAVTAVITAGLASTVMAAALVLVIPSIWDTAEFLQGSVAGIALGLGLASLYHALGLTSASLVGPITAVLGAVVPVLYETVGDGLPERLVLWGIVVAIVGLALNGIAPEFEGDVRGGITWAVIAGVIIGFSLVLSGTSSEAAGMWPLISQRVFLTLAVVVLGVAQRKPMIVPGNLKYLSAFGGLLGAIGLGCYIAGTQRGSLAQVTIAFSLYSAVTAVWAAAIDGERVRWWQAVGFGFVLVGVAMIALSQSS